MTDTRPGIGTGIATSVDPDVFARRYLAHAGSQLPGRTGSALTELARDNLAFGAARVPYQTLCRVVDVDSETTAIDVVTGDAPYLVDSVRAELDRSGRPAERLLHPQMVVARDDEGRLTKVFDLDDNADVPDDATVESWMHIEIDAIPQAEHDHLATTLTNIFEDVHRAVHDAPAMYRLIRRLADELIAEPGEFDRETSEEAGELLRWLADGNYMILGHAAYSANDLANPNARTDDHDAQGVLRGSARISALELLPAFRSGAPLIIFKSPLVSTVRRSVRYDCVTVVTSVGTGAQMVHVFLGLITNAEDGTVGRVPVVRRRIAEVLLRSGVRADSHTGRQLLAALRTLPRDELLEAPTADLLRLTQLVVDRAEQGTVGVFARIHLNRDFISVLVYFPAERFGPETRRRVKDVILKYWGGEIVGRDDRIVELNLARLQFLIAVRPGTQPPSPDRPTVEAEVAKVTRRWSDDLADLLMLAVGEDTAERWLRKYAGALPEAYKEDFAAATAVRDLSRLEGLPAENGLGFDLYIPEEDEDADRRLKVFRTGQSVSLARALPIFTQMDIEVLDERPYELILAGGVEAWIYDFGLRLPVGVDFDEERAEHVIDALRLLWRDEIEHDGFNALVVRTSMTWWQANVLRAYAKYLRQAGTTFSQGYIEQALVDNPAIATALVELFESRFDPERDGEAPLVTGDESRIDNIEAMLADVASLDQDRILRSLLALVNATLRTNAYRTDADGNRRVALAVKLNPSAIPDLPAPRPRFEIWVYCPRVEGVHLRFGAVARGGLRWSDRREDFRTEVLGLVKAQMVKNAVIVPTGAKGGFVAKRLPDPNVDREAWLAEGVACYRMFIACLLDLTDNYVTENGVQHIVPPPQTRRYDADDAYLVVAADKGTATFSDIANGIAQEYGFWLGDAFASGGSVGYDHKAMGITARGAWESVKYHFRELGHDTQTQDFTVVGIGDMSGDVFGNGMLLSEHIRLVAAFDHRHVFLDPNPDAATSYAERRRLFDLPRSSWADYDTGLISAGGGVYPRTVKSIPITAQVASALGIADGTAKLTPTELIHAILTAPVDLLWNGGIGTYVKASTEPHSAVGDKANDALRADGLALRARVVGEGGNLGFTQLGRVEYARYGGPRSSDGTGAGGRINTDAIDNSAGVDTSDHEVNLKILLDRSVATGAITRGERNELLASVTDAVGAHVLRDNYEQNVLLGMARRLSPALVTVHHRFIKELEKAGQLDRAIESLPTDKEIMQREADGVGLFSPENAVLAAYSKITLTQHIEDSTLPDEPWFHRELAEYFPPSISARFADDLVNHPLHREIITTVVVNDMINHSGTTFVHRAIEETGADIAQITRAYAVAREVFGLAGLWADIEALDNVVPTDAQHAGYQEIRRLIDRATRWLVDVRFPITDVAAEIERFASTVREIGPRLTGLLRGKELDNLYTEVDRLVAMGLPRELALRLGELLNAFLLLDVVEIANASEHSPAEIAELHFALSEQFSVDELLTAITHLPRDDRWSTLARAAVRHDVYAALSSITSAVLRTTDDSLSGEERMATWMSANAERVERARGTVREALDRDTVDLATLSVALRVMRGLPG
jgi:glutamate dehydrogenase